MGCPSAIPGVAVTRTGSAWGASKGLCARAMLRLASTHALAQAMLRNRSMTTLSEYCPLAESRVLNGEDAMNVLGLGIPSAVAVPAIRKTLPSDRKSVV